MAESPRPPATFTPWRAWVLLLIFPLTVIATGLLIQAGDNAWMLNIDAGSVWTPQGEQSVVRCIGDCR
ncbi:hypothetical protein [Amycolatopsis thermoflava]|uniref:hypothetical protein n=1 Tax=Amycolatopsis thermoflava TaxID=84480 RepID=UPI0004277F52|nr:hypothetical protein [Amycolatopsis thermoflava]